MFSSAPGIFLELPELLRRTDAPESRPIPYAGAAHLLHRIATADQTRRLFQRVPENSPKDASQVRLLHHSENSRTS